MVRLGIGEPLESVNVRPSSRGMTSRLRPTVDESVPPANSASKTLPSEVSLVPDVFTHVLIGYILGMLLSLDYRPPSGDLYLSSDRWPAVVAGLCALCVWAVDRRRDTHSET